MVACAADPHGASVDPGAALCAESRRPAGERCGGALQDQRERVGASTDAVRSRPVGSGRRCTLCKLDTFKKSAEICEGRAVEHSYQRGYTLCTGGLLEIMNGAQNTRGLLAGPVVHVAVANIGLGLQFRIEGRHIMRRRDAHRRQLAGENRGRLVRCMESHRISTRRGHVRVYLLHRHHVAGCHWAGITGETGVKRG